jgi:hypothetical protein
MRVSQPLYGTNSISTRAIGGGVVTDTEIANTSVTTQKLRDGNVTTGKLDQTQGQEAVSTETLRDLACTRPKIANNAVDATKLAANAVENAAIAPGSISSDKFGVLTSLDVSGGITATDITLSGSGATGSGGYSLAKAVYFNVDFDVDFPLTTEFSPIAGSAAVTFAYSDNVMMTTNVFRLVYAGDGQANEVQFVLAHRYYDSSGNPEPSMHASSYDSHSLVPGNTNQLETSLLSLSGNGDDKLIHSIAVFARKTGSGAVVIPAMSDWFGLCTIVQTTSSRQQYSWTSNGLVAD